MNVQVMLLCAGLLGGTVGVGLLILMGYKWGKFAALKALAEDSPKWKAYLLALLPPAAFAVTLLLDSSLGPFAGKLFCVFATPATIGTCVRINHAAYSAF